MPGLQILMYCIESEGKKTHNEYTKNKELTVY